MTKITIAPEKSTTFVNVTWRDHAQTARTGETFRVVDGLKLGEQVRPGVPNLSLGDRTATFRLGRDMAGRLAAIFEQEQGSRSRLQRDGRILSAFVLGLNALNICDMTDLPLTNKAFEGGQQLGQLAMGAKYAKPERGGVYAVVGSSGSYVEGVAIGLGDDKHCLTIHPAGGGDTPYDYRLTVANMTQRNGHNGTFWLAQVVPPVEQ